MKKLTGFVIITLFFTPIYFNPSDVFAVKKFIPSVKRTVRSSSLKISIPSVVKFRPDRNGILLSFANFNGINNVSYSFTYNANGIPQGAGGTISANNNPTSTRELLFGTCSTSVCTYHHNLSDAKLILRAQYSSGRVITKTYRIKTNR